MSFAVGRKVVFRRIAFAALTGVSLVACTSALYAQAPAARQAAGAASVSVPAGSLESGILSLGRQLNLRLLYPSALTRGKQTAGVNGSLAPGAAVSALLAGTGLVHRFSGTNVVQIFDPSAPLTTGATPEGAISLETIEVQGDGARALQNDGLAKDGYRASTISSVGPLGSMALKDTPFSVSVVPRELLQNIQAQSPDDVLKISPSTRTVVPQSTGWTPMITIRGFQTYDIAEDGLRRSSSFATVLEDKERVEILNGLSGFLYGAGAPAGIVNYVYKRPTFERLTSITTGTYGGGQAYVHGDFGGRLDEAGRIGYRLNVVREYGDTSIDDQKINRGLVSGALDWQATDALKFELNASYNRYRFESPTAYWFYTTGVSRKPVPDASKNWSQPWIRDQFEKGRIAGRMTYDVTDWLKFRGAYSYEDYRRPVQDHTQNSVPSAGVYRQIAIHSGPTRQTFEAGQALFDADFATGPLSHKLTFGYYMQQNRSWSTTYSPNSGWLGPFSLATPVRLPIPTFAVNRTEPYYAGVTRNHNFVVGDQIDFGKHWSALVGVNYSRIENQSFNAVGARSQPDYDEGRLSPSASLIYKPLDWLSIYGTYVEGLEQGGVAPSTAANFGAVMRPMVSRQQEVGVKAQIGGVLLTGALFDIEKAYEFTNAGNLYVQDGTQRHRGIELTATGKVTEALTVVGGVTLLDAKIEGGANDGKDPMNVARVLAKLYAEYELPGVPGLVLTGGVYHTGNQWANAVNVDKLPAYTTLDLGMRYTTEIAGKPLTLRLNVNNVTDKNYFQNSYYLGAPRTVAFSAQMKF